METAQFVLTHDGAPDGKTAAFLSSLQSIAALQDEHYHALIDVLHAGKRYDQQREDRAAAATENLRGTLTAFAAAHGLNPKPLLQYFGDSLYPDNRNCVPVFHADYTSAEGWRGAAEESIGDVGKRACILPAGIDTNAAYGRLAGTMEHFRRNGCRPVLVELSQQHGTPREVRHETIQGVDIPVIGVSPNHAMHYLCTQLGITDCLRHSFRETAARPGSGSPARDA